MSYTSDIEKKEVTLKYGDVTTLFAAAIASSDLFSQDKLQQILEACASIGRVLLNAKTEFEKEYHED